MVSSFVPRLGDPHVLPTLSAEFFAGLLGVVLADLVLAGDNAVVIALAARNLPKEQRRKAVIFGAALAIILRAALTVGAVFLLRGEIPFVMLIGGCALLWIGWQLAVEEQHDHEGIDSARTMRGAVKTILVADVVMSVDNVLAVAAFAKNDIWLVVIGLLISIPIIMGGATILLRIIDRFPVIVWVGAALIMYVAIELILKDPVLHDILPAFLEPTWTHRVVGIVVGVVGTSIAWHVRRTDDDSDPALQDQSNPDDPTDSREESDGTESRLMVEGSITDE